MTKPRRWPWLAVGLSLLAYAILTKDFWPSLRFDGLDGAGLVCVLWYLLHGRAPAAGLPRLALMAGVGITLLAGWAVLTLQYR